MIYKVKTYFTDMQDDNHAYHEGDIFPREGVIASEQRLAELSSSANKRGTPVIEPILDEVTEEAVEDKPRKKKGRENNADGDMSEN